MKKTLRNIILSGLLTLGIAGGLLEKLQAQERKSNFTNDFIPIASFTLDHDNDGYEDIYILTKNPYEQLAEIRVIYNDKGDFTETAAKLGYEIPMDNNSGISAFTLDYNKTGYKNIYTITTYNNKAEIRVIYNDKGDFTETAAKLDYDIPLGFPKQ